MDGQHMIQDSWPQSMILTFWFVRPFALPTFSIWWTISIPLVTRPNTTCLPSSQGVSEPVMKNWDPLLLGPELAMLTTPGPEWRSAKFSSANFAPYMDSPPVPLPRTKSPPWIMKLGMTRWKVDPLNHKFFWGVDFSPVQSALSRRKWKKVLKQKEGRVWSNHKKRKQIYDYLIRIISTIRIRRLSTTLQFNKTSKLNTFELFTWNFRLFLEPHQIWEWFQYDPLVYPQSKYQSRPLGLEVLENDSFSQTQKLCWAKEVQYIFIR